MLYPLSYMPSTKPTITQTKLLCIVSIALSNHYSSISHAPNIDRLLNPGKSYSRLGVSTPESWSYTPRMHYQTSPIPKRVRVRDWDWVTKFSYLSLSLLAVGITFGADVITTVYIGSNLQTILTNVPTGATRKSERSINSTHSRSS